MSHPGPPAVEIELTDAERARLTGVSVESSRVAVRARIVLACAEGASNAQVARQLGIAVATVRRWRGAAALDQPGPDRGGGGDDAGADAEECHALVAGVDGGAQRPVEVDHRADLARFRPQATPHRHLQIVIRSAAGGEGRRRRWPVSPPARTRGGAVR